MKRKNPSYIEIISKVYLEASLKPDSKGFYAVAHGKRPGVYQSWEYEVSTSNDFFKDQTNCSEPKLVVDGVSDASYKRFETRHEADAFIGAWKQSFAGTCRREN